MLLKRKNKEVNMNIVLHFIINENVYKREWRRYSLHTADGGLIQSMDSGSRKAGLPLSLVPLLVRFIFVV